MSTADLPPLSERIVEMLNASLGGFNELIGLRFVSVSYDELVAEVPVRPELLQPYGLVHGGVYASMLETLASTGAAINAMPLGRHTVGLENSTSFLRAVRTGVLRARAVPLARGRRTQVWEVTVSDQDGRRVASGRVRVLCIDKDASIAGEKVALPPEARFTAPDEGETPQ